MPVSKLQVSLVVREHVLTVARRTALAALQPEVAGIITVRLWRVRRALKKRYGHVTVPHAPT